MRKSLLILIIISLLFLPSCKKPLEIKDMAIVAGLAVDKTKDGKFQLTTQAIKPGAAMKDAPEPYIIQVTTGLTIFEAVRDFIIVQGKKQLWTHVQVFIIGKQVAEEGLFAVTDFMMRDHEPRARMKMFLAMERGGDILKIHSKIGGVSAILMRKGIEEQLNLGKAPDVEFHEFVENLVEPYQDPYLPIVHANKDTIEIFGTGIFKGDKLVGTLTPKETRGLMRVLGELRGGLQVLKLPPAEGKKPNYISIEIKKSKSSIKAMVNDKPKIIINIEETGFIGGINQPFVLTQQKIKEIEKRYANAIKLEVTHTVDKIQKQYKSHVFGFAGAINRENKTYWHSHQDMWEDLYPTIEIVVNVKTHIPENGLIRKMIK